MNAPNAYHRTTEVNVTARVPMRHVLEAAARTGDWVTAWAIEYVGIQWVAFGIDRESV